MKIDPETEISKKLTQHFNRMIISGSSTTQFTTSAPVVDNRSTISANK